jgi:exodeoxyribonuclease VII small subunit
MNESDQADFMTKVEPLSYEETFSELEKVVASLEGGELPLDTSLSLYEQGKLLAQHCQKLLEQAELRVRMYADEAPPPQEDK